MQAHISSLSPLHFLLTPTSVIFLHFRSFPCFFSLLFFLAHLATEILLPSSSRLTLACCLLFLWLLRVWEPLKQIKGCALVFSPLPVPCPASRLPARGGDWDAADNAAAGSSLALIIPREPTMVWFGFLQPGLIFHISDVNGSSNPPLTLLIKFAPYAFEGRWTDWRACFFSTSLPGASGLIRPQPWWG